MLRSVLLRLILALQKYIFICNKISIKINAIHNYKEGDGEHWSL